MRSVVRPTPRTVDATPRVARASAIAERVATFLDASPPGIGRVHSVFDRALNVLCGDGRLLVLHGPGPLAAPFAIAVGERVSWREIERGARVTRDARGHIVVGDLRIATAGARIARTAMGAGACHVLAAALADADGAGAFEARFAEIASPADVRTLASPIALDAMRRISDAIRRGDAHELLAGGRALIGLGEGLTPAGDDLLVGVLAVIHRARPPLLRDAPAVVASLADAARAGTTAIAREFLLHALAGDFSEPIVELLMAEDLDRARGGLRHVLAMGATSGADTMAGMRLAVDALSR